MGTVIGKGGMNVRHIMMTTGCRIKVADDDDPATNTRSVEIHGAYEQCQAAQHMIQVRCRADNL
jgi:transcription antitermination factor NusA-like protein